MLDCYWDHLAGIHDMCSVFRASEVLNTTSSCVLLCSVVFRASETVNTTNSESQCIISCVQLCSQLTQLTVNLSASSVVVAEILTEIGNVFSSEFSCIGIVG